MKYTTIILGEEEYPISFGMSSLARFLDTLGIKIAQIGELNDHLSLSATLELIHIGLVDGGRKAGKPYEKEFSDTCDLLDEGGFEAIEEALSVFAESLPQNEKKAKGGRKVKSVS